MSRSSPSRRPHRDAARGLTLIEIMIAVSVLSMVSLMIYAAFSSLSRGKARASTLGERYRLARVAMSRMAREVSSAYLSAHRAGVPALQVTASAFVGTNRRVDFNAFAHRRIVKDAHESDQCELSYFTVSNSKRSNQTDLVRREQTIIDEQFGKGGAVQILVDDVDTFSIRYFDPMTGNWIDTWDSLSSSANLNRLPLEIEFYLVLKGGPAGEPIRLRTKTQLQIPQVLDFALK